MIKINGTVVEKKSFPDGTLLVKAPEITKGWTDVTFCWLYENDSELFMLQSLADKYEDYITRLVLPYIPHARMDRVKNEEDVFTLKTFCKIINSMCFKEVIVFDPHSDVSTALLDKVKVLPNLPLVNVCRDAAIKDNDDMVFFYPDAGAAKRYSIPDEIYTYGIKTRNWETGKIENLVIAEPKVVKDKDVIIVDDICSYGGTFVRAAAALKEAGAREIILVVSHCEKNIFKGKVFEDSNIDLVVTSNSLLSQKDVPENLEEKVIILNMF